MGYISATLALVGGLVLLGAVWKKQFKSKGFFRMLSLIVGIVLVVWSAGAFATQAGWLNLGSSNGLFLATTGVSSAGAGTGASAGANPAPQPANYQPTATFATKDTFAPTAITGTNWYIVGSLPATNTAPSNTNAGTTYTFWTQNNSGYWTAPQTLVASSGATNFLAYGFLNSSASITLYDTKNHVTLATATQNLSSGAGQTNNVDLTYTGTYKGSAMPFGGVMVVDYNSTISSVTCAGADLTDVNPYHVTYQVTDTSHIYKIFAVANSLDNGQITSGHTISCQILQGSTYAGVGGSFKYTFIPANYYVSQTGQILLDTEKNADNDNTRTALINSPTATFYWA